jgi:hypothetical protein
MAAIPIHIGKPIGLRAALFEAWRTGASLGNFFRMDMVLDGAIMARWLDFT